MNLARDNTIQHKTTAITDYLVLSVHCGSINKLNRSYREIFSRSYSSHTCLNIKHEYFSIKNRYRNDLLSITELQLKKLHGEYDILSLFFFKKKLL